MKTLHLFLSIALFIFPLVGFSQDGSPDITFGDNGVVLTDIEGNEDNVRSTAQSENGRIVVIGQTADFILGTNKNFIAAYLESGNLDASFGNNGILLSDIPSGESHKVLKIQNDDKMLIGSGYSTDFKIRRFLSDGSLDTGFGVNSMLFPFINNEYGYDFELDSDNNLLFSGTEIISNTSTIFFKKYLPNGVPDTSFGSNGKVNFRLPNSSNLDLGRLKLQQDNKIIISCRYTENNSKLNVVIRFMSNGTINESFGVNGIALIPIEEEFRCSVLSFTNGSVLSSCSYWDQVLEISFKKMLKLFPDGTFDEGFGVDGYVEDAYGSIIQNNQRIITDHSSSDWEGGIYLGLGRYFSNGAVDDSFEFSSNYSGTLGYMSAMLLNNGKILVVGSDIWYNSPEINISLQRFNNNPLGVPEFNTEEFKVFPNPSEGIFTLKSSSDFDSEPNYLVTDASGKIIQKGIIQNRKTKIDLSEVRTGMYFLKAKNTRLKLLKN